MLFYDSAVTDVDGFTYSVDMIRFVFTMRNDCVSDICSYFSAVNRFDITEYAPNVRTNKYRYLYTVDYGDSTGTFLFGFNGYKRADFFLGAVEFNPNKAMCPQLMKDLNFINARCISFTIKRFDVAVDIPVNINDLLVVKDKRKYEYLYNSKDDKTYYLGSRSSGGFVKVYNKKIESDLEDDLTRIEITFDADIDKGLKNYLPDIYFKNVDVNGVVLDNLTPTQSVLVQALKQIPENKELFSQLDKHIQAKLRPYVYSENKKIRLDQKIILEFYEQINYKYHTF